MWRRPVYSAVKFPFNLRLLRFLFLIFFLYLAVQSFIFIESSLRPTIISISEAKAKAMATEAINNAINLNIAQDSRYEHLIFIQKDNQGNIIMAEVNNMEVARIQALTTMNVQAALRELKSQKITIPLGQALGSEFLANFGPKIPITLVPIGTVTANMKQSFTTTGINIVSHQVGIDITASVQIIIPLTTAEISVNTFTPVVTATYFGRVPETVINLPMPFDFQFPSTLDNPGN